MSCRKEIGQTCHYSHKSEEKDDHAYGAVYEPHGADVEMGTYFVYGIGDNPPPSERTCHNGYESYNVMIEPDVGHQEIEAGEESYYQKKNERIGECEQESCEYVFLRVGFLFFKGALELCGRILSEEIETESDKHSRTYELNHILVAFDKTLNERESEACQQAVEKVGYGGAHAGEETGASPFVESALDAKDSHRTHGSRDENADGDSTPDHIEETFEEVHFCSVGYDVASVAGVQALITPETIFEITGGCGAGNGRPAPVVTLNREPQTGHTAS